MTEFVARTGALRYNASHGGFEAVYPPTDAQIKAVIRAHAQNFRGETLHIDWADPKTGDIIKAAEIDRPTVEKVKDFFSERGGQPLFALSGGSGGARTPPSGIADLMKNFAEGGKRHFHAQFPEHGPNDWVPAAKR